MVIGVVEFGRSCKELGRDFYKYIENCVVFLGFFELLRSLEDVVRIRGDD